MFVEPMAHGTCFLGPHTQGHVLLASVEFPEVLFLSLVMDIENTGNRFANSLDLGELGRHHLSLWRCTAGTALPSGHPAVPAATPSFQEGLQPY